MIFVGTFANQIVWNLWFVIFQIHSFTFHLSVVTFLHCYQESCQNTMAYMFVHAVFNPVPPRFCHLIYSHCDKKYPCLGGLGLNKRFKLRIDCMVFNNWFSSFSYSPNSFSMLPSINITVLGIYRRILQKNSITVKRFF